MRTALVAAVLVYGMSWQAAARAQSDRHVKFTYAARVTNLPSDARTIDVWLPVPSDTKAQQILSVDFDSPVKGQILTEARFGNRVWHATFAAPPSGDIAVSQMVEVVRTALGDTDTAHSHQSEKSAKTALFLQPSRMVPQTKRFSTTARAAVKSLMLPTAQGRVLFDHVLSRMTYDKSGTGWGRGDANYACDVGKGNCSDFHSYFIALARSLHIPARLRMGFPLPAKRGRGSIGGYHCWAEFWTPMRGWVPVDISEADKHPDQRDAFFGGIDENRIAFSLGRDLVLPPGQKGPPLNFLIYPYVEVDGVPWDYVTHEFTYQDVR